MPRILPALVLLLSTSGCASPSPPPAAAEPLAVVRPRPESPDPPPVPRAGAGDVPVARVSGAEIRRSDLGDFVIRYFRDQAGEALTHLVDERIIEAEVRAHGITLPPGAVERAVAGELREREETVRVQFGSDVTLERYLRERYGASLDEHRRDLARLLRVRLLRDRVIRFQQLREDRIEARDAVFADLGAARRAAAAARAGADLGRLAKEEGLGGEVLPPFPRDELTPPELAETVFSLAAGGVSDPIEVDEGGVKRYHVFKVIRRMPAREVSWPEAREEVEADLASRPLERFEYLQWARQMRKRYRVEVLR